MIIHTVYRPEEVLDYLESWLIHHIKIGVTHFYMYDNSGSSNQSIHPINSREREIIKLGELGRNKYGFKHNYTPKEASEKQLHILKKYPVTRIDWKNRDSYGNILYNQTESVLHFKENVKQGLCAFIDVDEYIIKNEDFKEGFIFQRNFKNMFYYDSVYDCHEHIPLNTNKWSPKVILDMANFPKFDASNPKHTIHFEHLIGIIPETKNFFNHYNYTSYSHKHVLKNIDIYDPTWKYRNEKDWNKCFEYMEDTGIKK
jgi:hypothetical protein